VEIHFDEALAGTINVVMYAECDNVIEIESLLENTVEATGIVQRLVLLRVKHVL
jgi:hypothetical protein